MPTIGVALAIPEPWATELQDYRTSVGDAMAATIPTHITLVPPTEVTDEELEEIEEHLGRGGRRGTGVRGPPPRHRHLPSGLAGGVRDRGRGHLAVRAAGGRRTPGPLAVDLAFPYHPHVTVAHHVAEDRLDQAFAELADFECQFEVADFRLYVHDHQRGWTPTRDFTLQPGT